MTETILALIPDYGLYLVFGVVVLACLAAPLPASMLVLASGAFAAAGDLLLWQVFATTFVGYVVGDQIAFHLAQAAGPAILGRLRRSPKMASLVDRSALLLQEKGPTAVVMSHTIISPTCPYVSYLCGAGGLPWRAFTPAACLGALVWTLAYVGLGYAFAEQITRVSSILSSFFGLILALALLIGSGYWLSRKWRAFRDADILAVERQ